MSAPTEEFFDVVDADDRVIAQAPRSVVHRRKLLHRAVHVFVLTPDGRLLLQQRSRYKDQFPLTYTSSASGHVACGEGYLEAARRELSEELGIVAELEFLVKLPACAQLAYEHSALFRTTSEGPFHFDEREIDRLAWQPLDAIAAQIAANPAAFSPPFRTLFAWYLRHIAPAGV